VSTVPAPAPPRPDADAGPAAAAARDGAPREMRTIKGYSVPGEGSSTLISVVTVVGLFALWWVATHMGWIKDLFLPTPERIITSFGDAWKGDIQGGKPLSEHFWWSLWRVFAAFVLA
jgi:taurine transport system permease protein